MSTEFTSRCPEQVTLGTLSLYCENFKVVQSTVLSEKPTISGKTQTTGFCRKAARITLRGRIHCMGRAMRETADISSMTDWYDLVYRGVRYRNCRIVGYTVEDTGGEFISLTLILSAEGSIQPEGEW